MRHHSFFLAASNLLAYPFDYRLQLTEQIMVSVLVQHVMKRRIRCARLFSSAEYSPVNIFKEGSDPELKPAAEYPEFLQNLHKPLPTVAQLERIEERTMEEEDRFIKLINRMRIKSNNLSRS